MEEELVETVLSRIRKTSKSGKEANHRRLIVLCGKNWVNAELAGKVTAEAVKIMGEEKKVKIFYVTSSTGKPAENLDCKLFLKELVSTKKIDFEPVTFPETFKIMGKTIDILIINLVHNSNPDDLGRIIGTVRGGGLIIFLAPPYKKWENHRNKFHKKLVTYPYTLEQVKTLFEKRVINKLHEHKGVMIVDVDRGVIIKDFELGFSKKREKKRVKVPTDIVFARRIYTLCLTQDQVKVVESIDKLFRSKSRNKKILVVIADRGRGKSAAVGLSLAGLIDYLIKNKKRREIVVTAPELSNASILMKFLEVGLKRLYKEVNKSAEAEGITEISCCNLQATFLPPPKIKTKTDILVVDEAAGIPLPILYELIGKGEFVVLASTTHGYEGAGRGFSIRLLKKLKESKNLTLKEIKLKEPVRYSGNDPVEKWLYDTLLLDAEPDEITKKDLECIEKGELIFEKADLEKWFLVKEKELRKFIGIYVYAHYRNRPSDAALLADAPHHEAWYVKTKTNKIVNALQVAYEGEFNNGMIEEIKRGKDPQGHIIPTLMVKYHRSYIFPFKKGLRVIRIATHPAVMNKGIGSFALKKITEHAKEKGLSWIGSVFGASAELMKFWMKNKFEPVHVTLVKNPISGEYSVCLIKPLTDEMKEIIQVSSVDFKKRFMGWLAGILYDMNPDVAQHLLHSTLKIKNQTYSINLTEEEILRLRNYLSDVIFFEYVSDVARTLAVKYFLEPEKPRLTSLEEKTLIVKFLQCRGWIKASKTLGLNKKQTINISKESLNKLFTYYYGKTEERDE